MKALKKMAAAMLCISMILALAACGGSSSSGTAGSSSQAGPASTEGADSNQTQNDTVKPIKIKVAAPVVESNPMWVLIDYWQKKIDEMVPGKVEWENYPNSTLATERESGEMVMDGTLDAALVGPSNITSFAPMNAVRLQDMPFLFKDGDELYAAGTEWMNEKINEECAPYGLTTVFFEYIMGQEIENSKRPITDVESVKGLKIRVYDSPGPYNFLEACGGLPVTMAFSEVYSGIQQGACDGLYTTVSNFVPQKFVEVCKYHTKLTITNLGMCMLFNLDTLNSYPQDVRDAIIEAGKLTEQYCKETLSPQTKENAYKEIEAAGVEINEVTGEEYDEFVKTVQDYCYEDLRKEVGEELWDFCINWLEEYRAAQN